MIVVMFEGREQRCRKRHRFALSIMSTLRTLERIGNNGTHTLEEADVFQ